MHMDGQLENKNYIWYVKQRAQKVLMTSDQMKLGKSVVVNDISEKLLAWITNM